MRYFYGTAGTLSLIKKSWRHGGRSGPCVIGTINQVDCVPRLPGWRRMEKVCDGFTYFLQVSESRRRRV